MNSWTIAVAGLPKISSLLLFLCASLVVSQVRAEGLDKDPFKAAHDEDVRTLADFKASIQKTENPVNRFMVCARKVIEINKFLADPENTGTLNTSFDQEGPFQNEQQRMRHAEKVAENNQKIRMSGMSHFLKRGILAMMESDLALIDERHRSEFGQVLKALR